MFLFFATHIIENEMLCMLRNGEFDSGFSFKSRISYTSICMMILNVARQVKECSKQGHGILAVYRSKSKSRSILRSNKFYPVIEGLGSFLSENDTNKSK